MSDVVKGQFTIDLARAREKLGKYQLADPYAYVLEFVQAAALRGAKVIDIFVDTDDLKISFTGEPFQAEELHNLEMAVLDDATNSLQRSRKKMAMGLLAVQTLQPASMVIESSDGHLWTKEQKKAATLITKSANRTDNFIHVKMPWSLSALLDRFRSRKTLREEELLLQKHCTVTEILIIHNGEVISRPPSEAVDKNCLAGVTITAPHISGWGGLVPGSPAELTLIANGVTVDKLSLELGEIPFQAVVEGSNLTTDISGTSVQKDDEYERVLTRVRKAREKSLVNLETSDALRYAEEIKRELLALEKLNPNGDLKTSPACLMKYPVLKYSDGRDCSLLQLKETVDKSGFLPYSVEMHIEENLEEYDGVLYADYELQKTVKTLTGWSTRNVTRLLRQQVEAKANQRAWRARTAKAGLTGTVYQSRFKFATQSVQGEVGVKAVNDPALIRIISDGCLLCEWSPQQWPSGLEVALSGSFVPIKTFDNISHNADSVEALLEATKYTRMMYEELAEMNKPAFGAVLADFLRVASMNSPVEYLLEACGVPTATYSALIRPYEWPSLEQEEESPLLDVSWVKTEGEQHLSIRDLKATQKSSPLLISESQKGTLERLLGDTFLHNEEEDSSESKTTFRLDPAELREERFLAFLRRELNRATGSSELRLGGFNLSRLILKSDSPPDQILSLDSSGAVHLHRSHPLIEDALQKDQQDSVLLLLIVSVLLTSINRATAQFTDADEQAMQLSVAQCLISGPLRAETEASGTPEGVFEPITEDGFCTGWVHDPSGLGLRLYFADPSQGGEPDAVVPLDSPRKEGGFHFLFELPPHALDGEKVEVHACVIHPTEGRLIELQGSPRAYAAPHKAPAKPIGRILEVTDQGVCRGWCVDPNNPAGSPQIEFYLDGNWKSGEWLGYCRADIPDSTIAEETGFRGHHVFEFQIPGQYRDGTKHTVYAYGFDLEATAGNPLLEGSPLEFFLPPTHSEGDDAWEKGRRALEELDFETAISLFRTRIQLGGTQVPDHEVWSFLGSAYSGKSDLSEADKAFREAVRLAPWQSEHWYFSGLSKLKLGYLREALSRFRKAVELDPENGEALFEIALLTRDTREAVTLWEKLLARDDFQERERAYSALLSLHLNSGQRERATELLVAAEEEGISNFRELLKQLETTKLNSEASLPQAGSKKAAAEEEQALFEQAREAVSRGDNERALSILKGIEVRGRLQAPGDLFWLEVARANFNLGRFKASQKALKRALTFNPESSEIYCELGRALQADNQQEKALVAFREALRLQPESRTAQLLLAEFYEKTGESESAEEIRKRLHQSSNA